MKHTLILCAILFLILTQVKAQQPPKVKFEKVSDEEMKMTVYAPDTTAEAVILYDSGSSEVNYDVSKGEFMLSYDRFVRIKILKQTGTEWGNFSIPLYSSDKNKEDMVAVKGATFNYENGKVVKTEMKKESIFRERENKYSEMVRLSLPSVKIGSVIDLKYTISSPLLWNLREWKFQYLIPVKWSQYEVIYPEYFKYNHSSMGYNPLNSQSHDRKNVSLNYTAKYETGGSAFHGGGVRKQEIETITYMSDMYHYTAMDVPSLKEEPYLTTLENYTTKVKFELANIDLTKVGGMLKSYTSTWNDIGKLLLDDEDFGGQIKSANFAKEEIASLLVGKTDEKQKMIALYTYIQLTIKWNGIKSYSTSASLKKIFSDKNGNSADVNLLLVAMLTEAGIEAYPVILSTRTNGLISFVHASLSDCNYVIVKAIINGAPVFLDATEPNLQAGLIPFRCLNGPGRLIKKDNVEEVELTNVGSVSSTLVSLELKEGKFTGNIMSRKKGLNDFNFRESVKDAGGPKEYFEKLRDRAIDIQYNDYSFSNLDSLYIPIVVKYPIALQNEAESAQDADILYFNPILIDRTTKNPFSSPSREYPVDYGGTSSDSYQLILLIPEGYKVEELPQNKTFALEGKSGSYIYKAAQVGNNISLSVRLNLDKTLFLPAEYKMLQDFYNIIIAKESEQIVFKKISQQ